MIRIKRIYDAPSPDDGTRILVDRLWPRGLARRDAAVTLWLKEAAPSTGLRKWFGHDPDRWDRFRKAFFAELDARPDVTAEILKAERSGTVTLLYGSREERFNNAAALREYLASRKLTRERKRAA